MSTTTGSIELVDFGVSPSCPYSDILEENLVPTIAEEQGDFANGAGLAFGSALAEELANNRCDYIFSGRCRAAEFAIQKATETLVVLGAEVNPVSDIVAALVLTEDIGLDLSSAEALSIDEEGIPRNLMPGTEYMLLNQAQLDAVTAGEIEPVTILPKGQDNQFRFAFPTLDTSVLSTNAYQKKKKKSDKA